MSLRELCFMHNVDANFLRFMVYLKTGVLLRQSIPVCPTEDWVHNPAVLPTDEESRWTSTEPQKADQTRSLSCCGMFPYGTSLTAFHLTQAYRTHRALFAHSL